MSSSSRFRRRSSRLVVAVLMLVTSACSSSTEPSSEATTTITGVVSSVDVTPTAVGVTTTAAASTNDTFDVESLYAAKGNRDAGTVLVFAQGGPAAGLDSYGFGLLVDGLDLDEVYVLNVHQAQTLDASSFVASDIDFQAAKAAQDESVNILAQVVDHFRSGGRRVVVLGISFGAFLVQDLLATQGSVADAYVIVVGRLDLPDEAWTIFSEGGAVEFVGGDDIVEVPIERFGYGSGTPEGERNMSRVFAAASSKRYTSLLMEVDLSNVTYVYAEADDQVGRLNESEIGFLEAGGATVIADPGGHVDAIFAQTGPALATVLP